MKIVKVNNLPQTYEADTIYLVKSSTAGLMDIYVTDNTGTQIRSLANGGPLSPQEISQLQQYLANMNAVESAVTASAQSAVEATDQADMAMGYRNSAGLYAATATTQAVIATERATQALASQNAAADYAAVSSASAALANDWATKTSSEVVPGQGFGAKKYALDAEQSAINAETSFQSGVNAAQVLVDGFRTYRTVSTSLPSGVPRQGEEWIVVQ